MFVHAGIDPARSLAEQGDSFWWGAGAFDHIARPFETFARIFRGFDPSRQGANLDGYAVTLDGGTQDGGPLLVAGIASDGRIIDLIEG